MNILQLGIKDWPYSSGKKEKKNRGGGTGKYCDVLFEALEDCNVNFFIITRKHQGQDSVEKKEKLTIYRYNTFPGRKIRHISLAIITLFKALKIIRKHKIDIIHSHMFLSNVIAIFIGKILKIPVLIVPHSAMYHKYLPEFNVLRRRFERFVERKVYPLASKCIMFCQSDVDVFSRTIGFNFGNFEIIPTGFKAPRLTVPNFDFKNRKIKILFVGRLIKLKALDKLINAISKISEPHKNNIILNIVGEGEEKKNLISLTKNNNLESIIKFHGFIQDPIQFYMDTDIFCLVSETEGQSLALMEAMANFSVCLVNDFGVPFHSDSLIILSNNLPNTIKENIEKLLNNKNLISKYSIRARAEIENQYSIEKFGDNYYKLYKSILHVESGDNV